MNRRELLKYFSVGTVIAPLTGGMVERSAAAELIEIPKVKLIEPTMILTPLMLDDIQSAALALRMTDGTTRTVELDRPWSYGGRISPREEVVLRMEFERVQSSSPLTTQTIGTIAFWGELK